MAEDERLTAAGANATARQQKWFASVQAGLERDTGKSLDAWVAVARTCPHTMSRARVNWMRTEHGLGVNRALTVLHNAFPEASSGWDDPAALRARLWTDAGSRAILEAVERAAAGVDDLVVSQRKGYTAFSRQVQFAAMRPLKGGEARLALKLEPDASPRLIAPARKEGWSERLTASVDLGAAAEVDEEIGGLFRLAAERG